MSTTTSQGLVVYGLSEGSPSWILSKGVPTAASVDAAFARVAGIANTAKTDASKAVKFDAAQALTAAQQRQIQANIGVKQLPQLDAAELMATKLGMAAGDINVGIASDSTANGKDDWPGVFMRLLATRWPKLRIVHKLWNDSTQAYAADDVVSAGQGTPPSGGTIIDDQFARTGEASGSNPNTGPAWAGPTGVWSTDGTYLLHTSAVAGNLTASNLASKDLVVTTDYSLITTGSGGAQNHRIILGAAPNYSLTTSININAGGTFSATVWKLSNGVQSNVESVDLSTLGLVANSATPQIVQVKVQINIQNLTWTFTANGKTVTKTGTLTETEYGALANRVDLYGSAVAAPGLRIDRLTVGTPITPGQVQTITFWNGAVAGKSADYQQTRLGSLYPQPIDVLVLSHGHNYGSDTPATFRVKIQSFIDAYRIAHPESLLLVASQNPQFAPSPTVAAHRLRQAEMRLVARENAAAYVGVFERFTARPDGGQSWMQSDGIHPTIAGGFYTVDGSGASEWGKATQDIIAERVL